MAKPRATVWPLATSIRQPLCTLFGPPALRRVGLGQGGHVLRRAVGHGQAVEVAAVLGRQGREERRPPARHEAVPAVERAQAAEGRVDQPQLVARPGQLVGLDLAGEVGGARQEAGVVAAGRLDAGGEVGGGVQEPDLGAGGDGDGVGLDGQPHGALEVVVRQRQLARRDADGDDLARLVGGHEQGDAELAQQRRQRVRVLVADFARGRGAVPLRRRGVGVGAPARDLDFHQGHGNPLVSLLCDGGLRYNGSDNASGAQTERRGGAGPVGGLLGGKDPTGRFVQCRGQSSLQDRAEAKAPGDERVAAVAEQVEIEPLIHPPLVLLSPITTMVIVFVVSPGAKVSVPDLAM